MDAALKAEAMERQLYLFEMGKLEKLLAATPAVLKDIDAQIGVVQTAYVSFCKSQDVYLDLLWKADQQDEYLKERQLRNTFQYQLQVAEGEARSLALGDRSTGGDPSTRKADRYRMNLPQRKLPEFGGDVRGWLGFWASFEEIHNDPDIPDAEKFQYLLQCLTPNSAARRLVEGFPVAAKNYGSAIESLKNQFGRDKMLVKVYVRDLVELVINKATQKKMEFTDLVPQLSSQIGNLEELGVTSDKCEQILYPVIESCIPDEVLQAWQRNPNYEERIKKLMKFLNTEVQNTMDRSLARMRFVNTTEAGADSGKKNSGKGKGSKEKDVPTVAGFLTTTDENNGNGWCVFCNKGHNSQDCVTALSWPLEKRRALIKRRRRCFSCLLKGHFTGECNEIVKCCICGQRHYPITCPKVRSSQISTQSTSDCEAGKSREAGSSSKDGGSKGEVKEKSGMVNQVERPEVVLQTLTVMLHGPTGTKRKTRAVFDSCSQSSYIIEKVAREVGLELVGEETVSHLTFGGNKSSPIKHNIFKMEVSALDGKQNYYFDVSATDKITGTISGVPSGQWINECCTLGIRLTDLDPITEDIEIMIGADVFGKLMTGRKHDLKSGPTAMESLLGWVLSGKLPTLARKGKNNVMTTIHMHTMDEVVKNMWALEAIGITDPVDLKSRDELEQSAVDHFEKTVVQLEDGRYEVSLPWLEGHPPLPDNRMAAVSRLKRATEQLVKDDKINQYEEVFNSWIEEGIIEEVPHKELMNEAHYLPHRPVYKEHSSTPVRPVFDGSAKTKTTPSLNDCVEKGPNLLELIPAVLSRFRMEKVGVVSDIKKAFLQMSINKLDRDLMRFLWWSNMERRELMEFRHCRVVFGVTCSPFLLGATLKHHLSKSKIYRDTATQLLQSFYVDNSLASFPTVEEAERFKAESQELLLPAKFDLRGWEFGPSQDEKWVPVLGMVWNTKTDMLKLELSKLKQNLDRPGTKRVLLSLCNMLYDPLGFVCPYALLPKLMLQETWEEKGLGWDDPLPEKIEHSFLRWKSEIVLLEDLMFPRWVARQTCDKSKWSLHVFSDASGKAYAACAFLRVEGYTGTTVQLIQAKNRISPMKKLTIPRLELLSCLIATRLAKNVKNYLMMPDMHTTFWSDSTTALAWIKTDCVWNTFVGNRVKEICASTNKEQWRHVPGTLNPADLPSRGSTVKFLAERHWWEGPDWLLKNEEEWPSSSAVADPVEVDREKKKTVVSALSTNVVPHFMERLLKYSDYHKILRVLAMMLRYVDKLKCRPGLKKVDPNISSCEETTLEWIEQAEMMMVRYVQNSAFADLKDSRLRKLRPFIDSQGIIRIKSRLVLGEDEDDFKCPIVLPGESEFVRRLIWKEHLLSCHAGVQVLMTRLRERFWILNSRRTVGNVLCPCLPCKKLNAKKYEVEQAPLPLNRIRMGKTFQVTGIDLAGPLWIRGKKKVWVVLYTCAVYRAVHLDLVESLSTADFILSLRKFVAKRGRPSVIYTDNGTNFTGCAKLFKAVDWSKVTRYADVSRIQWIFNPPSAAWWGGFWERLIGLMKQLIRRVVGNAVLSFRELETVLCEVEAVMNDRPLTYVSEDANDLRPLTPALFLRDIVQSGVPEADVVDGRSMNEELRRCQRVREALKSRFRKEYLSQLVHCGKNNNSPEPKVGDVVLIEMTDRKRLEWPMGVIEEVYVSKDGKLRRARIRTKNGEYMRPVQRLYPLEMASVWKPIEVDGKCHPHLKKRINEMKSRDHNEEACTVTRSGRIVKKPERL